VRTAVQLGEVSKHWILASQVEWESSLGGCGVAIRKEISFFFEILTPKGNCNWEEDKGKLYTVAPDETTTITNKHQGPDGHTSEARDRQMQH
jgi:hypothetical protein